MRRNISLAVIPPAGSLGSSERIADFEGKHDNVR